MLLKNKDLTQSLSFLVDFSMELKDWALQLLISFTYDNFTIAF